MGKKKTVYVVSYWGIGFDDETVVTVFDNRESAEQMKDFIADRVKRVWIDECPIYHSYRIFGDSPKSLASNGE